MQSLILHDGRTYTALAENAGISVSTISSIASGHTRFPRFETVLRVMKSFGYTVTFVNSGNLQ